MTIPMMILIAGPYRSGTGDDPQLLANNLAHLEEAAWPIFRAGHVPMIGEWVALPVLRGAGGSSVTDPVAGEIMYPTADRLLQHCDAVFRLPGASTGADQDVAIARERGLPVYYRLEDIPPTQRQPDAGNGSASRHDRQVLSTHVLDNPVFASLAGPHAHLALSVGQARRYPADISTFAGFADDADDGVWHDLYEIFGSGEVIGLTGDALAPPSGWPVLRSGEGVQLVATDALESRPYAEAVVLGADDAQDMLDLVEPPGPFLPRTYQLGTYLGVRVEGRLVAMAGERLHPPGYTEISAVCTHPDFRGRGYGTRLVQAVAHGIRERGDVPMMHASAANANAIRLYESIGFVLRKRTTFMAVRTPD